MKQDITVEEYNTLSFEEQVTYLLRDGHLLQAGINNVSYYRLFGFFVRMEVAPEAPRTVSLKAQVDKPEPLT
jgi:hypothetical protein